MVDAIQSDESFVDLTEDAPEADGEGDDAAMIAVWDDSDGDRDSALVLRAQSGTAFRVERAGLPDPVDARLVLVHDPSGAQARGYRLLRHRLLAAGDPQVIAVTSAARGEGKSTLASNLAFCLAEDSPGSVLLIDGNLRRPAVAGLFGLDALEDILDPSANAPPYAVVAIDGTKLHVALAPGGGLSDARLDRMQLGETLVDLRQAYDYIVIDAAAVLDAADAYIATELADGVVIAARARASRRSAIARAIEEIQPATVLGVALLDV